MKRRIGKAALKLADYKLRAKPVNVRLQIAMEFCFIKAIVGENRDKNCFAHPYDPAP